ncbi:GGDEF domain-containing protein [Duganella sp. HH105]|uniref:GGDEF domain-containing protein n=1 Tax=Duganella sp. HH105 TaxID=1781067 RepID=UPI000877C4BA|nr:GGDEF domain-containing protein [Duganella sp. HH105]OEZ56890.1 cyclic di-GMP phosphodiesterase Gmr [Duganella sp. HH105]
MMSYEAVHTLGSTTYFIFMLLFIWAVKIPRTNPGAGWWALSICCALLARLSLFFALPTDDQRLLPIYVAFNVLEKPLLLAGLARFLNLDLRLRWFWSAALAGELWLLLALAAGFAPFLRASGYCTVNAMLLAYMGRLILQNRAGFPRWPMAMAAAASLALAVHWLAAPALIELFPVWSRYAFVVGTALVLAQYFSLLAAVLALFQMRLIDAEAKALEMAFQDPLTGLNNKRYMTTLFDQALLLATRPHHVVAVFYIDLDNFKSINDTAGHGVGDEVLKTVAARLKSCTRSTDICARVGGDEFVVIATQLEHERQATEVAAKLLTRLTEGIQVDGKVYALGASIGIALYPQHGRSLAELVQCADNAMYHVKRNGKSGCVVYGANAS